MLAVRQHLVDGHGSLVVEEIAVPTVRAGTALIRVHAAGITRDELDWAAGRLPAIPSYELSGIVESVAADVDGVAAGDPVIALTDFDRDGVAAEHAVVRADLLAPKPAAVGHRESAALPLAGLSAWQGLFSFGRLERGQRVLIHGGTGGVGHLAIQLARWRGAHVIATGSGAGIHRAAELGADETLDRSADEFTEIEPVDLFFDTVGGEVLARSGDVVRPGGAVVSVAEEPSADRRRSRRQLLRRRAEPRAARKVGGAGGRWGARARDRRRVSARSGPGGVRPGPSAGQAWEGGPERDR